ncbi:MAG TPA: carboxypeptidase regulatory-like domain-containing protein [Gemmatimonadales bacterium]|nr:carboxypeptidase regulatory-like domain-containing protein [Gemmatimonadales bacterium]
MSRNRLLSILGFALLAFTPTLNAQTTTGTVRGYVKDQNATVIADAQVEARQAETGVIRSATSHSDGSYILPGLTPGNYVLSVRHIGFTPEQRSIVVQIGATLVVNFTVQAGAVELQAVTVQAGAPAVEMRTSELATNITPKQLQQLPTVNRNFLDLAVLAPGVTVSEDRINSIGLRTFSGGASGPNQSNVFVDGSSLKNDLTGGGVSGQDASRGNPFPRNAIQEYRVITQNFKAEYQKASSAIITATTRSGGNTWTGNAFFGYQNKNLIALDTFQLADKKKNPNFVEPEFKRYVTGLSTGGPLVRDKLFFFGSYEGNYQDRAYRVAITPPSGFTALDTVNLTQYNGNFTSPFRETLLFGKLNYAMDQKSSLEVSFNTRHETDVRDFGSGRALSTAVNFRQDVSIGQARYTRAMGSWLNEAKVDLSRFRRNPAPNEPGTWSRLFHYPGQDSRIGSDLSTQDFIQKRVGLRDDITYSGKQQHVIKGGVSVDFVKYDIQKLNNETPLFEYSQYVNPADWTWTTNATGVAFDFKNPFALQYATGAGHVNIDNNQVGAYLQDDWSPTSRLTFNLGVRWDYESNMLNRNYVTPDSTADTLRKYNDSLPTPLDLSRYISTGSNRKPFYGAFQPRVGVSYGLDNENRTVLFGGVGIYYDRSIFDFSVDEIQKLARPTYFVKFAPRDSSTLPPGTVAWNDSYLTADTATLSTLARTSGQPEAYLLDNKMKPPRSTQWSLGVRRALGSWVAALSYQGQRGTDLFTYNWANFGINPATGTCCVSFNIGAHGYRNIIYSTNDGKTWYDAVSLQLDRPYRASASGFGWGGGLTYTYARRYIAGVDALGDMNGSFPGGFPKANSIAKRIPGDGTDERHHVVANWIMDIPQLWGIQFSGLVTLGSGARLDVGTPPRFGGVADSNYFKAAFVPPGQPFFVFGSWAYRRVDLKFRKDFPQMGRGRLGATVDVFNVFNASNFGDYPLNVDAAAKTWTVGQPRQVISDPRRVQIGVEYTF